MSKKILEGQQQHWENIYGTSKPEAYAYAPTTFAAEVISLLSPGATIAELGCGWGSDTAYFAQHGYSTLGVDFSDVAIEQNRKRYGHIPTVAFQTVDISQPFPWEDSVFTALYARLSLHYFTDAVTKAVFHEIYRVLQPAGLLAFLCKSIHDPLYGEGEEIEQDMFITNDHVRHFFSEDYAKACLGDGFKIETLQSGTASFYGRTSGFVKVIAHKI